VYYGRPPETLPASAAGYFYGRRGRVGRVRPSLFIVSTRRSELETIIRAEVDSVDVHATSPSSIPVRCGTLRSADGVSTLITRCDHELAAIAFWKRVQSDALPTA